MFRDSRGVVHTVSSADPLADLPGGAARALQAALMAPTGDAATVDVGSVLERCDAVRELLERWQDAFFAALPDDVDLEEEGRWAAEAGMSLDELEAGYSEEDDDELDLDLLGAEDDLGEDPELDELVELLEREEPAEDDPRRLLPEELVAVLERELLLLPLRVRLEALVAAVDLVSTWADLVSDHEKLLGHLVLAHAEPQAVTGHEGLVDRHAALHAETGPAHVGP
ncbi:MAG: hypothetical protein H7323_16895 [Frankiales bacterium]|nr:hypothetical protein [Frankiales bacterium]